MLIRVVARRDFKSGHLGDFQPLPAVQILDSSTNFGTAPRLSRWSDVSASVHARAAPFETHTETESSSVLPSIEWPQKYSRLKLKISRCHVNLLAIHK
jgi:hypothetical protein